jgi:type IV secretion system protein VirD4
MTHGAKRRRKRPIAAATENIRPGAGDDLLVGWRSQPRKQRVGFTCDAAPVEEDEGDPLWLKGEGHLITIAPTGKGKGRGALIPNLLTYEGPVIVIDPKGEAYSVTARRRREMGQDVRVIDPFGVVTDKTDSLNPMDVFDLPDADPSALAMEVAKQLSGGGQSLQDPFWDIRGHDLVAGVISAVASTAEPHERNLNKVARYRWRQAAPFRLRGNLKFPADRRSLSLRHPRHRRQLSLHHRR